VHRFEETGTGVREACRRCKPDAPCERRGEVAQDVSEHVLRHDDVELVGGEHQLHRRVVDEHVLEPDVLVVGRHLGHDAPPHARRLEDVRLVDGHNTVASIPCELEGAA
jgi:hypothetical protein